MKIRFLSGNAGKIKETCSILASHGVEAIPVNRKIEEIQTSNVEALLRDKAIKAYSIVGRPLFVEHTGLYTRALNDFPAGLTQIFWDTLKADKVTDLFAKLGNQSVFARSHIGFIDGKTITSFSGEVEGRFADTPRGDPSFQWDCVFIPNGSSKTFGEMSQDEKNTLSMRRRALDSLARGLLKIA